MKQFGYTTLTKKSVNIYETDTSLWKELSAANPEFKGCLSCGACTAACPINNSGTTLNNRRTIIELNRGMAITSDAANCQMCNRCSLVCPKGLNTRRIFFELIRKRTEEKQ
ncbi:MAG: 4Fe-4S dicluster domain-containing protein [Bacteroidales bacterium]|nr:4Fe-4S dicluster domain-containing protein [Bacteroidales bacterium]